MGWELFKISEVLSKNIILNLQARNKEEVLREILEYFERKGVVKHKEDILKKILEREIISSTGIGHSIAIPHIRTELVSTPVLFAGISHIGVYFNSIDGEPVKIIFILLTPADDCDSTIAILSSLSKILQSAEIRKKLIDSKSINEFLNIIKAAERAQSQ
ncbi:MAG: PTS sugar transporter subunit IIA [bacterium]